MASLLSREVRRANRHDSGMIASVLRQTFAEFRSFYTEDAFEATTPGVVQIEARMDEGPIWVALENQTVVGTVSVVGKEGGLYVRSMAVISGMRGKGIGRALLEQVEEYAAANGFRRLLLTTTPFLSKAITLYASFGFYRTEEGPHDLFGTPLFAMEKKLRAT